MAAAALLAALAAACSTEAKKEKVDSTGSTDGGDTVAGDVGKDSGNEDISGLGDGLPADSRDTGADASVGDDDADAPGECGNGSGGDGGCGGDGKTYGDLGDLGGDGPDGPTDATDVGVLTECPASWPETGTPCEGYFSCGYGTECCCGDCFDDTVCECSNGKIRCYNTDACLGDPCGEVVELPFPCCEAGDPNACAVDKPMVCVQLPDVQYGKCVFETASPHCWWDSDCAEGDLCKGASICPCDADCDGEDKQGVCLPEEIPYGCCAEDKHCDLGNGPALECATYKADEPGVCVYPKGEGQCWDAADCPVGQYCKGASLCPCGLDCGMITAPGKCATGGNVGDVCGASGSADCGPDLVCCYPCGIPECEWKCQEPCDPAEPWCANGCPMLP